MNEDYLGLPKTISDFHDLLSTIKVDKRFTFLFDDAYGNCVAVDMRKIKTLAFVDVDSRGIDLKLEREMISWMEYQNSKKLSRMKFLCI